VNDGDVVLERVLVVAVVDDPSVDGAPLFQAGIGLAVVLSGQHPHVGLVEAVEIRNNKVNGCVGTDRPMNRKKTHASTQ